MLNITHYQRNANQNHNEVPFHASQNECFYLFIFFSVTALFYLEDSRRIHPPGMRACQPKDSNRKEQGSKPVCGRQREREPFPLFICFSLPLGLPYANWASQECCLFYLRSSLRSLDLPLIFLCSIFTGFSLPCLLATAILDSCFLF